jgi:coenzyme F420-reducing hydrogenase delta subunit
MLNVSAAMGGFFARSSTEFTEEIRALGPNPLKNSAVLERKEIIDP